MLKRSKTDQDGTGRWLHLCPKTAKALDDWLDILNQKEGYIFQSIGSRQNPKRQLCVSQINRIYKKLAVKANIEKQIIDRISGHSFRVGAAQDLLCSGATLPMIMSKGRWSKTDTVMRYIEHVNYPG